jgi:hypothetical protein
METKFQQGDLVRNDKGQLYVVDREKEYAPGTYTAISLELGYADVDVSDKTDRRICSFSELPTAVRSLLRCRQILDSGHGKHGTFGTRLTDAIRIIDELTTILAPETEDGSDSGA